MKHALNLFCLCTIVFCVILTRADEDPKDPSNRLQRLETSLQEQSKELEEQRKLTGGALLGVGGAFAISTLTGKYVGNEYATAVSPSYYGGLAAASTLVGFYVFFSSTSVERETEEFNGMSPIFKVEELHERVKKGEEILRSSSHQLRVKRILGGSFLVLQGAGQFYMSRTGDTIQSRDNLQRPGFAWSTVGLVGYAVDPHVLGMGTTFAVGTANLISYSTDQISPSKDYFLASGFFSMVLGVTRLVFLNESEKAWQKYKQVSFLPKPGGFVTTLAFDWD